MIRNSCVAIRNRCATKMVFEDYVDVTMVNQRMLRRFSSVDSAHQTFSRRGKVRLVWYKPDAATPSDEAA